VLATGLGIIVVLLARRPRRPAGAGGSASKPPVAEVTLPDGAELPEPMGQGR
jgi:hypothetical protein